MERKSLGRGIEDISHIFLSDQKDKKNSGGFSSKKLRDATCESCVSIIRNSPKPAKCRIFTLENKKYGVRYMETLSPSSASYCEFFEPIPQTNENPDAVQELSPANDNVECRIEESITIRRNITFPASPDAHQNILNSVSKHLEENYSIKSVDLRKTDEILQPGKIKYIDEEVTICIEDHPTESGMPPEVK
ncbi:MAG: hypothetical protein WB792_10025 [Desulfobacterales bacterium]